MVTTSEKLSNNRDSKVKSFLASKSSSNPPFFQPKLTVGAADDVYEREADAMADKVMQMPQPTLQRQCAGCEEEEKLQRKPLLSFITPIIQTKGDEGGVASDSVSHQIDNSKGSGSTLDGETQSFMEGRFGANFSEVKIHTGSDAVQMSRELNAQAFTIGNDIYFNEGKYSPGSENGKHLLAHELTHTIQQGSGKSQYSISKKDAMIQRRLVTFGTLPDVNTFLGLLGPRAGLTLAMNVATNQVVITAVLPGVPPSPTLRNRLTTIINHATQNAEVIIARGQPQVFVGAFPQPSDLTVTRTQQIDLDDVLAIDAGAPGNGVAFAIHEIEENFRAHGVTPVAGTDRFASTHRLAETNAENPVAAELVGPGRRVAFVQVPGTIVPTVAMNLLGLPVNIPGSISAVANTTAHFFDYENYYLGVTSRNVAATQDTQIVNARRFNKTVLSATTIDNFVSGSNAVPAAGAATIAAAAALVAANPTATVNIQGFSDSVGSVNGNRTASQRRADAVLAAMGVAGVARLSMHAEGLGAINFVAPNVTAADRARNRRVVITVTIPQL